MITLRKVGPRDRTLLFNLLQKYLSEMMCFYPEPVEDDGNYDYPYFDAYFTDHDRDAYIILYYDVIAGFAMVNRHSCVGDPIDHAVAEFFVLPAHRRHEIGLCAARLLFRMYPGRWEVKYHQQNEGAAAFWKRAIERFNPAHRLLPSKEAVYSFTV